MDRKVTKADHPPEYRRGTIQKQNATIQNQKSPSPDVRVAQQRPPTAGSTVQDNNVTNSSSVKVTPAPHKIAVHHSAGSRRAVVAPTHMAPEQGTRLADFRRRSFGVPQGIVSETEPSSRSSSNRNVLNMHDKPARPITFDHSRNSRDVSAWQLSIAKLVTEKASQDMLRGRRTDESSKTSVVDAILGSQWANPRTGSSDSSEDTHEELKRRCHPPAFLYYPHYAFVVIQRWLRRYSTIFHWVLFFLWLTYVIYAVIYNFYIMQFEYDWCNGGGLISWTSAFILAHLVIFRAILPHLHHISRLQEQICHPPFEFCKRMFGYTYVRVIAVVLTALLMVMLTQIGHMVPTEKQLIALCGYFVIILVAYFLSVEPERINWGVVTRNLVLQIFVVYLMMVWKSGRVVLECIAVKIAHFFTYSQEAALVLFPKRLTHMLAIELLSSLTLTGCFIHLFYYTGALQGFLHKFGTILEFVTGTTTVEAICAALCTLCGGIETSVILEPYIVLLTLSELHTFVVSGISSMTGVVLAMYMAMGVDRVTLMTVNFATFNGVLAISKIVYPETDTSVTTFQDLKFVDRDEYNLVDAGVRGAIAVIRLLAHIICALIAFVAMVNMGNLFVGWLLENIGIPNMDIVGILSVLLRPLIFLMGVEWRYTDRVARLYAIKTIKNEYFAYKTFTNDTTNPTMPPRESAVTTALLYGFSNLAHIGATTAYLTALAPERRHDISVTVPRAMLTAVLVNLLTAAVVGAIVTTHPEALRHHVTDVMNMTSKAPHFSPIEHR